MSDEAFAWESFWFLRCAEKYVDQTLHPELRRWYGAQLLPARNALVQAVLNEASHE